MVDNSNPADESKKTPVGSAAHKSKWLSPDLRSGPGPCGPNAPPHKLHKNAGAIVRKNLVMPDGSLPSFAELVEKAEALYKTSHRPNNYELWLEAGSRLATGEVKEVLWWTASIEEALRIKIALQSLISGYHRRRSEQGLRKLPHWAALLRVQVVEWPREIIPGSGKQLWPAMRITLKEDRQGKQRT